MARSRQKENELDFEKSLKKLEEIVQKLEEEEISLEASLKYYAEGQALVRACEGKLADAENKIKSLTESPSGEIGEEDFEAECEDAATADESDAESGVETPLPAKPAGDEIPF